MIKRAGKLNGLRPRLENAQKRSLIEAAMVVAQRAAGKAPRDTGRLKRSITHGQPEQVGPLHFRIAVGTNVVYARAHEFGSGLHATVGPRRKIPIVAKNKRALKFEWPNAPAGVKARQKQFPTVFFKSVMHPGVRARPYLRPALAESEPVIRAIFKRNIKAAFR